MTKTITLVDDRQAEFFDTEMQKVYSGHIEAAQEYQAVADRLNAKINKLIAARNTAQAEADDQQGRADAILSISIEE